MRILHVVGARPNFMKAAPVMAAMGLRPERFTQLLVHTGQHYDQNMSTVFFDQLGLPRPDVNLEVGSGSHAAQTAQIMMRFEPVLLEHRPDWVFVPGDVNSTIACALVATKLGVKVAHVEAGLRSYDRTMPEEINRILTDRISDLLLTPSRDADENLLHEGAAPERIRLVGNVMIDTLVRLLPEAEARWPALQARFGLNTFALATLHRPSNVDHEAPLCEILAAFEDVSSTLPILFPVHPRTRERIAKLGARLEGDRVRFIDPLGYLDFLALQSHAAVVLTDSGGIQEETTYLGVPCLTLRDSTERPVTITQGTNRLVPQKRAAIRSAMEEALHRGRQSNPPEFWDGKAAERIVDVMLDLER